MNELTMREIGKKGEAYSRALRRLVDYMVEEEITRVKGPEVYDFNRTLKDVQESLNYWKAQFGNTVE